MIRVFDESGNEVNPTYPKRARGLVKQGRARYADDADDVIVLTSNIEEKVAYPSDTEHTSEDTEMFEYNAIEEIRETAEVSEPVEEVNEIAEPIEPIEEIGLPLNEELNRLYGILVNIDKMLYNISAMGLSLPEEMNGMENEGIQAAANAIMSESNRLRSLAEHYVNMRAQTVALINKIKDDAKKPEPASDGWDEEVFIAEQIKITMASYKTMCQHLNDQLRMARIDMDDYCERMAEVQEDCNERIRKLRNTLDALKYGG